MARKQNTRHAGSSVMNSEKASKKKENIKNIKLFAYIVFPAVILIAVIFMIEIEQHQPGQDAVKTLELLSSSKTRYSIMNGDAVNIDKLRSMDIDLLRKEYDIKSDLAIYFEDSESQLKPVDGISCFGSPKIEVNGKACNS